MLRCYNLLRLWCRSGTGVSREMSLTNTICDGVTGLRELSLVSGTQMSWVQLFIWLTLLSLTCQDWLIISQISIMRDLGQWILLVTYFCVHWSGHRGSGSNLAQLRLESAESVAWGAPGTPGHQTSGPGLSVIRSGARHSLAAWIVRVIWLAILSSDSLNQMKCWYLCNLQSQVHNCFMLDLVPLLDCSGPGLCDVKLSLNNATAAWLPVSWQTH